MLTVLGRRLSWDFGEDYIDLWINKLVRLLNPARLMP